MVSVKQIKNFATEVLASVASRLIPAGGATGYVLKKVNNDDYQVEWAEENTGGSNDAVLYTEQELTAEQKTQACNNIGVGNPDTDLLSYYNAV